MANKITIAELDLDVNSLIKSTTDVKAVIDQLREAQKQLTKDGDTASEQFVQNSADLKVLTQAYNANLKAIADSTNAKAEEANRTQLVSLALQTEVTSIKEAREQNSLLNKLRNETNVTTVEGKKQLDELNAKLNQNNDFIKENADQYLQQKINIGNYSDSIKDALSNLNPLNGGLAGFTQRAQEAGGVLPLLSNGLKAVTTGIYGMVKASLTFLATPIGAVIGAIGLVLGGLITYLKSTQEGIDKITAVTRPLMAIFDSLIGVVQKVGKGLFEAFSNPKKTLEELADFVKQNLINRFTAFGKILEGIINLDFKQITDGVLQAGTGVENLTDKIADGAKATGKFLDDAAKKGAEIDRLQKEIEKGQLAFEANTIAVNNALDEQQLIAKDTSKTFEERAKASQEIIRLTTEQGNEEAKIIEKKIKQLEIQQSLNDTSREGQMELIDLRKQLDDAQDRGVEAEKEQLRVLAGLKKEQQAQEKERQKEAEAQRQKALEDSIKNSELEIQLFQEKNRLTAKSELEIFNILEESTKKELELFNFKLKNKLISQKEFDLETLKLKNDLTAAQNKIEEDELKRTQEFENRKKTLLEQIELQKETDAQAKEELKLQQDFEKQVLELENLQLTEDQKTELLKLIEENRGTLLQDIRDKFLEQSVQKQKAVSQALIDNRKAQADAEISVVKNVTGILLGLLGDSLGAQLASIAIQAAIEAGLVSITTAASQAKNLAQATAVAPPPLNAPFIASAIAQNAVMQANSTSAISRIITGAALTGLSKSINKFEEGGAMLVGGNRHSQGGTKFVGSDGTRFEAEKGELIGVLNRKASSRFMAFNDAFGSKGQIGTSYAQTGGLIARGMDSGVSDLQELALLTANAVSQLPSPIVTVEDINTVGNRVAVIENGANFG